MGERGTPRLTADQLTVSCHRGCVLPLGTMRASLEGSAVELAEWAEKLLRSDPCVSAVNRTEASLLWPRRITVALPHNRPEMLWQKPLDLEQETRPVICGSKAKRRTIRISFPVTILRASPGNSVVSRPLA